MSMAPCFHGEIRKISNFWLKKKVTYLGEGIIGDGVIWVCCL